MRRLWLLRHAKAAPIEAGDDHERPLTAKGISAHARDVGAWAAGQHMAPDLILCSTAMRTRQSLTLLLPFLAGKPEVAYEDGLYLADIPALLERLRQVPDECQGVICWSGHNPGIHALGVMLLRVEHRRPRPASCWRRTCRPRPWPGFRSTRILGRIGPRRRRSAWTR